MTDPTLLAHLDTIRALAAPPAGLAAPAAPAAPPAELAAPPAEPSDASSVLGAIAEAVDAHELSDGPAPWESAGLRLGDGNREGWRRWVEARCVEAGGWPLSPWWLATLGEVGRLRVYRVGRRGGKSSTLVRVAVADALAAPRPSFGDVGIYAVLSAKREQAADRLRTAREVLQACGIDDRGTSTAIRLPHGNEIRVYTASTSGVVSGTIIGAILDEVALWADSRGRNPADDIFAALIPAMATIPDAECHIVSAPWSSRDPHARFFARAETSSGWMRAACASWKSNPTLTEDRCREIAISDAEFMRAYAAIPIDNDTEYLFTPALIHRAMRECTLPVVAKTAAADWAFRRNASAFALASLRSDGTLDLRGKPRTIATLEACREWRPSPNEPLKPSAVFADARRDAMQFGAPRVIADTHYAESAREGLHGLALLDAPTRPSDVYLEVQRLMLEDCIALVANERLEAQFAEVKAHREPGGHTRIELPTLPDGTHCDMVSAAVLALWHASTLAGSTGRMVIGARLNRRAG